MAPEKNTSSNAYAFSKFFCQSWCLKPYLSSRVGTTGSAWMQIQQGCLPMLWSCKKRYWKNEKQIQTSCSGLYASVMPKVTCWNLKSSTIVLRVWGFCGWVLSHNNHILLPGRNAPIAAIWGYIFINCSTWEHKSS